MRIFTLLILLVCSWFALSCGEAQVPSNSAKEISKHSPIGVLQTFTDAKNAKDLETMKRTLSKGTLDTINGVAEGNGKTMDEYLFPGNTTPLNRPEMPQTRNENIVGEIATVEISRFPGDQWRKLTFIREDGAWKMDLNLYMKELYPRRNQDFANPPPPPSAK